VKVKSNIIQQKNSTEQDTDTVQMIYGLRTPSNTKEELNIKKKKKKEIHHHPNQKYLNTQQYSISNEQYKWL